jgi:predicted double-glycine peptidase
MVKLLSLPLVSQETDYTCGTAAVKSVLQNLGKHFPESVLAERLGSNPKYGTAYNRIVSFFENLQIETEAKEGMTIECLEKSIDNGFPVIVCFQAWGIPEQYEEGWDEGHYSVVAGYDADNFYFMDPSTNDKYAFIPKEEFLRRWHDLDIDTKNYSMLRKFGITIQYPAEFRCKYEVLAEQFAKLD